eukprot:8627927-Pyramimonas_sp.AAC.1
MASSFNDAPCTETAGTVGCSFVSPAAARIRGRAAVLDGADAVHVRCPRWLRVVVLHHLCLALLRAAPARTARAGVRPCTARPRRPGNHYTLGLLTIIGRAGPACIARRLRPAHRVRRRRRGRRL